MLANAVYSYNLVFPPQSLFVFVSPMWPLTLSLHCNSPPKRVQAT